MRCSLILTTYNWKEALALSLKSALSQSTAASEIIIADDGSRKDTAIMIKEMAKDSPIPIIHVWQKDEGFQLSKIRNKAIKKSTSDYIIVSDGDMILHSHFIKDHLACAKEGYYIQGSRVLMDESYSQKLLKNALFKTPTFFSKHIKNRKNSLYLPFLTKQVCQKRSQQLKRIRGCNFSLYKKDIYKVNGFNEDFKTWGREDSEFVQRLYNIGMKRKNLKFAAIQYHIHHKSGHASSENDMLLEQTITQKLTWCKNGIT
ncbi:MAG TPA: glycosyltransferase [Sulfurospirillum arcachonense]|nr:glycosyltransferase [Sulfurospirillum arcachonense]HIP44202.1 glycosyltransferase [Sulfurospirillum arcachonense]